MHKNIGKPKTFPAPAVRKYDVQEWFVVARYRFRKASQSGGKPPHYKTQANGEA